MHLMRHLLNVRNWPEQFRALHDLLGPENSFPAIARFFLLEQIGRKALVPLSISGHSVFIRTLSPDMEVAVSSLGSEFQQLARYFSKDRKGLIVDAGGYIGTAAIALSVMYPEATVVSIEPSSENFATLQRNVAGRKNIRVLNAALVSGPGAGPIELMDRGTGYWGLTVIKKPQDRPAAPIEKVDTVCIDDILEKHGFDRIMILKMDIEGAELELLERSNWLEKTDVLMIELHEKIVAGCERAFQIANESRLVHKTEGEKFISIAPTVLGQ